MTLFEIIVCVLLFVMVVALIDIGASINSNAKELISVVNAQLGNIDVSALEIRDAVNNLVLEDVPEDNTEWLEDVPVKEIEPSKGAEF